MGFTKYQKVEDARLLEQQEAERIADGLRLTGKTSAAQLTETERKTILDTQR